MEIGGIAPVAVVQHIAKMKSLKRLSLTFADSFRRNCEEENLQSSHSAFITLNQIERRSFLILIY